MVGLPKEYQDVHETSKDVIRLKQRHMIKGVLERLNFISLPQDTVITKLTHDQVRFFFGDILSLIIDNDSTVQAEAIKAIGKFLLNVGSSAYQDNSEWPIIRDKIVEEYTKHISIVRDSSNNINWYKIWCLLIQVLDQDIIRSVLIINKFLSIVEQSFKSPDLEVRAQAFICWKILVKMFFKYNELIPTKRVKLVSIPFRSSQAKTLFAAETKLESYWYFLVKLSESEVCSADNNIKNSLELHQELVFGPFLQFCFGNSVRGGISTLKQYPKMKDMAIFVLIAMLNPNNKEIEIQLEKCNLEKPKEAIISEIIMKTNWKAIIRSCFEASLMIGQCNGRNKLFELLWHGLIHQVIQAKNPEIYKECCSIIRQLIEVDKENPEFLMKTNILYIVETFGSHYNYLYDINSNTANYVQIFEIITCITDILLLTDDHYFPTNVFESITKNIYDIEKYKSLTKFWELQKDLIEYILTTDQLNDFTNFTIKISVWKTLSMVLRNYMDAKLFELRLQSKAEVVNKWIVWPLKKCGWLGEKNYAIEKVLDNAFFVIWKRIMHSASNAEGKSNFVKLMLPSMKMLCDKREKISNFDDVFACYVDCMDQNFEKNSKPSESLDLIRTMLSKTPPKSTGYNKTIEKFSKYVCSLNENRINLIFQELKSITTTLVQAEKLKHITRNSLENYKKAVADLLKKDSIDKKYLKEFRLALKSDEFVIIPSVWALNPERLTEHQKEKMKEKKDHIPALYNDMNSDSHSQDSSSIKPWTPNKIVIPRGKEQLIISSPKVSNEKNSSEAEKPADKKNESSPFKKPKEKSDSMSSLDRSPLKKAKEKFESSSSNNNDIASSEQNNVEKMVKDSKEKEKDAALTVKSNAKKSKSKFVVTKEDEKLLKSMKIETEDNKKKSHILSSLKALQIDTVEGKNFFKSQFKADDSGIRTRKSTNPKKITGNIKKKKIKDDKETTKTNKKSKKSITFDGEKDNKSDNKNKENKNEILAKQNEKISNTILPTQNIIMEKLQTSTGLNSEDEVIESSQKSESIVTRRLRKPSFNITTVVQDENIKKNSVKSPLKTSLRSPKKLDFLVQDSTKISEVNTTSVEGKSRTLRSSSTSPMVDNNESKSNTLGFTEKRNSVTENKKISEMQTELNTELLISEKSIIQSPTKIGTLRNNINLPMVDKNNSKNKKLGSTEKSVYMVENERISCNISESPTGLRTLQNKKLNCTEKHTTPEKEKIAEMDTELNTEFLRPGRSITQFSKNANLTQTESENENALNKNEKTNRSDQIIQSTNNGELNSLLMNDIILAESEISSKSEFLSKSPRKRLIYDISEEKRAKNNVRLTGNVLRDFETDPNSTDSIVFPSLLQSPNAVIEKKLRSNLTGKLSSFVLEDSPKKQKVLDGGSKEESPRLTRSNPANSPKSPLNVAEMETELNTENMLNTEKTITQNEMRSRSPRKLPNWARKKFNEQDTEPNTEILNTSVEKKSIAPSSPSTPKHDDNIYQYIEERALQSPAFSPIKSISNSIRKSLNQSIIASPECRNANEKNAEFMNDTVNISPIPIDAEKDERNTNNACNTDHLFDELKNLEFEKNFIEDVKQTSPIRKSLRPASLNSPPDRKNTNNSASPVPKPKAQAGLTGRGAQLINMIRNRKTDPSNRFACSPFRSPKQDELSNSQEQQTDITNPPSPPKRSSDNNNDTIAAPPTPLQGQQPIRDLLTFSKTLPSPYASPSASILKRKLRKESLDDFESPANKRKRVSFHDPPVSVTKEYVKHVEEDKPVQTRLNKMLQERTSTPTNNSIKHSLKRKNRIDSMLELARFNDSSIHQSNIRMIEIPRKSIQNVVDHSDMADPVDNDQQIPSLIPNSDIMAELQECDSSKQIIVNEPTNDVPATSVVMDSLKFNATADSTTNPHQNCDRVIVDEDGDELQLIATSPSIYFTDEAAVLKYVVDKYGFDEIYEKYSERKEKDFLTNKLVRTIFRDLSTVMEKDVRIKTNVLEILSEKHPKEFLDHAIQENLSSVVCERLNTNSVIDYICETFKNNADSRKMILDKISNILTTDRFNQERHEYFMKLLHYEKMTSDEIIDCMEIISKNRR